MPSVKATANHNDRQPLCAAYVRVSTERQDATNQRPSLERLASSRGWSIRWYGETESAARERPILAQMLEDARRGEIQAVAVWALDRLHRSMVGTIQTVLDLDRLGVQVVSVRDSWLDTRGPVRELLLAIFGWVAEQERRRLIERTREGLARAKARGTKSGRAIGRPKITEREKNPVQPEHLEELLRQGWSAGHIARTLRVSERTIRRRMAARKASMTKPPAENISARGEFSAGWPT